MQIKQNVGLRSANPPIGGVPNLQFGIFHRLCQTENLALRYKIFLSYIIFQSFSCGILRT